MSQDAVFYSWYSLVTSRYQAYAEVRVAPVQASQLPTSRRVAITLRRFCICAAAVEAVGIQRHQTSCFFFLGIHS